MLHSPLMANAVRFWKAPGAAIGIMLPDTPLIVMARLVRAIQFSENKLDRPHL